MFNLIPNFTWLPWYLQILIGVPIGIFIVLALFRFITAIIELFRNIRGIIFG
jgi:hypothetical protein